MNKRQIAEEKETRKQLHHHEGYDPLKAVWRQSRAFNTSWFNEGGSLSVVQRIGYTAISLAFLGAALYFLVDAAVGFRERDSTFWLSALGGIFFFLIGVLGLRNVLRFKREPKK